MTEPALTGELVNYEEPVWDPLIEAVGDDLVGWFMWMHELRLEDGTAVHAYKHRSTRRYLHVDETLTAYDYVEGTYLPAPLVRGVAGAFAEWPMLGATRADMVAVDLAIDRAAARGRTTTGTETA